MRHGTKMKNWLLAISLTILGGSMSACAMGGTSWKEEVLLHDGKIEVESSPGQGSRFRILLPGITSPQKYRLPWKRSCQHVLLKTGGSNPSGNGNPPYINIREPR